MLWPSFAHCDWNGKPSSPPCGGAGTTLGPRGRRDCTPTPGFRLRSKPASAVILADSIASSVPRHARTRGRRRRWRRHYRRVAAVVRHRPFLLLTKTKLDQACLGTVVGPREAQAGFLYQLTSTRFFLHQCVSHTMTTMVANRTNNWNASVFAEQKQQRRVRNTAAAAPPPPLVSPPRRGCLIRRICTDTGMLRSKLRHL